MPFSMKANLEFVVYFSLGGFTALVAAVGLPEQVVGLVLLNNAGQFGDRLKPPNLRKPKQPARIESVLKNVYIDTSNVDDYLVESIRMPANDPNAGEVYYSIQHIPATACFTVRTVDYPQVDDTVHAKSNGVHSGQFLEQANLSTPVAAGHCPHDEVPELVNKALAEWLSTLQTKASLQTV
ncbi:hypothetical protein F3Y22_tig00110330pilonHSYRG00093 [Hibiscus syriacus]|uniref:AB hydrolase-1 domain-containing protein n=1 Tax=Hibiscus syriacus TaxID=106335 RepID=A0A6A3B1G5_HIBSY|nr:hypothetical protein F3Y22_tig00110330pilonHSYRG00093 [Hibiscus syriacus]